MFSGFAKALMFPSGRMDHKALPLLIIGVTDGICIPDQEIDADVASDEAEKCADQHP